MLITFTTFAFVGAIGTLAHYLALILLVECLLINPVLASGCGALLGMLVNYGLNYRFTFNSQQTHRQTFPKFAAIACLGLLGNLAIMAVLADKLYYLYAQISATLIVLLWNFAANSLWTFKSNPAQAVHSSLSISGMFAGSGLLLTVLAIRLLTLGLYPLYDPSESRYAEMARKMIETKQWLMPMIDYGVPFWGKPPLTIWLSAISMSIGGIHEFSVRLPSFLLGLGSIGIIFYLQRCQHDLERARNAALILASCVLSFVMSGTVAMDQCMSFGLSLALASFWLAIRHDRPLFGYIFFIGLSIGLLAKGPITLVLGGIVIMFWTAILREWLTVWQRIPWITGTLLMLCISVPWFVLAEKASPGFLEYFIVGEHWRRFTEQGWTGDLYGVGRSHAHGMIWLYWLGATFPWCLFLFGTLAKAIRQGSASTLLSASDGWRLYCLLWMIAPLAFFSFSANIIWTYVLPGLPGFALLLSDWLEPAKRRLAAALCVPIAFIGLIIVYQFSDIDFYKSQKILVSSYQAQASAGERLIYVEYRPDSAQFYLHGKTLEEPIASSFHGIDNGDFYIVRKSDQEYLPDTIKQQLDIVKSYGRFILLHRKK